MWVSFVVFSCALALVFTFTGAMAAAMMMSVAVQVAIKRHMHVLHRRDMATHFVVEDLICAARLAAVPLLKFSSRRPWCGKRLSLALSHVHIETIFLYRDRLRANIGINLREKGVFCRWRGASNHYGSDFGGKSRGAKPADVAAEAARRRRGCRGCSKVRIAQGGQQRLVVSACTVCKVWSVCTVLLLATAVVYVWYGMGEWP